jgi:hypothetical protein
MTDSWGGRESDGRPGRTPRRRQSFRVEELLPLVRAAMTGRGAPAAVRDWVARQGIPAADPETWTATDETRARLLARRLTADLKRRQAAGSR